MHDFSLKMKIIVSIASFVCLFCTALSADNQSGNGVEEETEWKSDSPPITYANDFEGISIESYYSPPHDHPDKIEHSLAAPKETPPAIKGRPPYRLHKGDKLAISIYGDPQTRREVSVDPTGSISFLFINSMHVLGKTIDQVRKDLEDKLKSFFRNPILSITPITFGDEYYTISGQVLQPGRKILDPEATVLSALCEAGGFPYLSFRGQVIDQVDLNHSFLSRNGDFVPVDFTRLIKEGDLSQDLRLKPGDYIHIHNLEAQQIYVLGEVGTATAIQYFNTITLAEALTDAGGLTSIASSRVVVIRGSLACPLRYVIDINRIVKGAARDFMLEPGDIVYAPPMRFTTFKEVVRFAIACFVGNVASIGGTNAYLDITPKARGTNVLSPTPVVNFGPSQSTFISPTQRPGPVLLPPGL